MDIKVFRIWLFLLCMLSLPSVRAEIAVSIAGWGNLNPPRNEFSVGDANVIYIGPSRGGGIYWSTNGVDPTGASHPYVPGFTLTTTPGTYDFRVVTYNNDLSVAERRQITLHIGQPLQLNVSTPINGSYQLQSDPPGPAILSNAVVTLNALDLKGWTFKEWRGDIQSTERQLQFTLKSNVSLSLVHETPFTVTSSGPGSVRIEPLKPGYEHGETVWIYADPQPRAFFKGWSLANSMRDPEVFLVTSPTQKVTGSFQAAEEGQVVLDTDATPQTMSIAPTPSRYVFFPGETVTVSAAVQQARLTGWAGHPEFHGSNSVTFTISADTKLVAEGDHPVLWTRTLDGGINPVAIGHDGTIYATTAASLYAISPTGEILWQLRKPGLSWPVIGPSGSLYFSSAEGVSSYTRSGDFRWLSPGSASPLALDPDENIYFIRNTELVSLTRDGSHRWTTTDSQASDSPPVVTASGLVINYGLNNRIAAYDQTGSLLWSNQKTLYNTELLISPFDEVVFVERRPRVFFLNQSGGTNLVVALRDLDPKIRIDSDGSFYEWAMRDLFAPPEHNRKFDRNGNLLLSELPGFLPLIDQANNAYIPTDSRLVIGGWFHYAISPTGERLYTGSVTADFQTAAIGPDNTLIARGLSHLAANLYATRVLAGPNPNAWGTFRGNSQRTGSFMPANIDTPPSLPSFSDSVSTNNGAFEITFTISDDNADPEEIVVTAVSDDQSLIDDSNIVVLRDGSTWTLRVTPTSGAIGTARVTLTATDDADNTSTREFLLTLENPPAPPELLVDLVPALTLVGEVGETYRLESRPKVEDGEWTTLSTVTLTNQIQIVHIDLTALDGHDRFYRAVLE